MAKSKLSELGEQQAGQGCVWLIEMHTVGGHWVPRSAPFFSHGAAMKSLNRLRKQATTGTLRIMPYIRQEAATS